MVPYKVMIADDEPIVRKAMQALIDWEGLDCRLVRMAANGQEVMEELQNSTPDILILDIQMPVLDGYGAARAIRALPRPDAQTIPILAMTANAFTDDVAAAREAGMNGHIAKPVDMGRIKAVLATVLPPR